MHGEFHFSYSLVVWNKVAINEMTMGFQGMYIDNRQIAYKVEGAGFQDDALADDGCCYQLYMQNGPPLKKYS